VSSVGAVGVLGVRWAMLDEPSRPRGVAPPAEPGRSYVMFRCHHALLQGVRVRACPFFVPELTQISDAERQYFFTYR
jgi:hypothetical protein